MSFAFLLLAYLAAVNPARLRLGVPGDPGTGRARIAALGAGALLVFALAATGVAGAEELLGWLDISPETWRIAAGLVLALTGAWFMVSPAPAAEPELPGMGAALVPVAFPLLITPQLFVLVISTGADEPAGRALGALAVALGLAVAQGAVPLRAGGHRGALVAASRLFGAVLVVAGVAFIVSGIREV